MGCTKVGHVHQWPMKGTLIVQRCETRCNFCEGEAALKDWKYAWFLRRHVRAVHVKTGQYPNLEVDGGWDERKPRGPAKSRVKNEDSGDDSSPPRFVAQPIYDEQREQGMIAPFVNPSDLNIDGEFDFNNYPFPAFGNEEIGEYGAQYTLEDFNDFFLEATGDAAAAYGMIPSDNSRHGVTHDDTVTGAAVFDEFGIPVIGNEDDTRSTTADHPDDGLPITADNDTTGADDNALPSADSYDAFYMSDYDDDDDDDDTLSTVSEDIPLADRSLEDLAYYSLKVDQTKHDRVMAYLNLATDAMAEEGLDVDDMLCGLATSARLIARRIDKNPGSLHTRSYPFNSPTERSAFFPGTQKQTAEVVDLTDE